MYANIDDFVEDLNKLKKEYLPNSELETVYKRTDKVSIRITISSSIFIDVYANIENNRYDLSLIKDNQRVFGYDNLESWHYHPLNKQDDHIEIDEPSFNKIFNELTNLIHIL
ncbi:integrase [Candidatus Scalindua japonica]|uniref:Integrase n=1 Tax=Candidatus Scalindua japonica TaxID=1284222 RepID=A0A286TZ90_9BACT|nr:hypothetical protein [Candidatus Scalindua japonica]GAX61213.1 integrase [Candidatus Scalindua japonica]